MLIIYMIVILCVLIFVHELGHFTAAKLSGVKVNEFALGMGPAFFKRKRGETQYSLRVFPIGGFCAMEGEDGGSDDGRSFEKKPAWIRAIILAAGSFMNIVLAVLIMSAIIFYAGTSSTTEIKTVMQDSPALAAGILPGDKIVKIDGAEIKIWEDVTREITGTKKDSVSIEVIRDGKNVALEVAPQTEEDGRRIIGITPKASRNPFKAVALGTRASYDLMKNMVGVFGQLFTGDVSASELTGPVGIAYIARDTAKMGMRPVLYLVSLISLNLAIVNMLPLPALDGGRLLFLLIRKITGKAISDTMESRIHLIGIMLLLALMVYVTWNDIERFIIGSLG